MVNSAVATPQVGHSSSALAMPLSLALRVVVESISLSHSICASAPPLATAETDMAS